MATKTIGSVDVSGKKVLIRVDFNVPVEDGRISDDRRIREAVPTIKSVLDRGGAAVLMSHMGRPDGTGYEAEHSLKIAAERLAELLGTPVQFPSHDCVDQTAAQAVASLRPGQVLLLENLRFHKEEKTGGTEFAGKLAAYGDVYVNDAFGTAHRPDASMVAVPAAMSGKPRVAGLLMEKEIKYLSEALAKPQRPFAVVLGLMAGYFKGWIDDLVQYIYTTLSSIPGVLLIAASVLLTQVWMDNRPELFETVSERADVRLLFLCLILGVTGWTGLCRLLRGEALKLREADYVQAARAFGVRDARILSRHLLPNVMHIVLIAVVMDFSGLVLAEAVLSYVGVGVDPSMISFGTMINNARLELARDPIVWWSLAAAFVFMFALVLSANLFADAVRDAFDPRIRSGWGLPRLRAPVAAR